MKYLPVLRVRRSKNSKWLFVRLEDEDTDRDSKTLFWRWASDQELDLDRLRESFAHTRGYGQIPGHLEESLTKFFVLEGIPDEEWYPNWERDH